MDRLPPPSPGRRWPDALRFWTQDLLAEARSVRELVGLLGSAPDDGEVRELLALVAARLVDEARAIDMLVASGIDPGTHAVATSLDGLLREVRAACVGVPGIGGRFLRIASPPETTIVTDPGLLRRAVVGMVRCALAAAPRGTMAELTVEADERDVRLVVRCPGPAPAYFATARDDGADPGGEHAFGLHAIGVLVQRWLGGELTVRSEPGHGTTIAIALPRRPRLGETVATYGAALAAAG